jgi:hypothetical protein
MLPRECVIVPGIMLEAFYDAYFSGWLDQSRRVDLAIGCTLCHWSKLAAGHHASESRVHASRRRDVLRRRCARDLSELLASLSFDQYGSDPSLPHRMTETGAAPEGSDRLDTKKASLLAITTLCVDQAARVIFRAALPRGVRVGGSPCDL